jgi:hypothetical protein
MSDPSCTDHLRSCAACHTRYVELTGFLTDLKHDANADADAIFTTARLATQHATIMQRLETQRAGNVISFPGRGAQQGTSPSPRVAPRWLVAAAAASLFVGMAIGRTILNPAWSGRASFAESSQRTPAPSLAPQPASSVAPATPTAADDDAFLMELEAALQRPHIRELQPLDALTPYVREIGNRSR